MQMINVEISKDIPLPLPRRRYPYAEMQVGESFLVDGGSLQVVCNANYRAGKRLRCEEGVYGACVLYEPCRAFP